MGDLDLRAGSELDYEGWDSAGWIGGGVGGGFVRAVDEGDVGLSVWEVLEVQGNAKAGGTGGAVVGVEMDFICNGGVRHLD